MTQDIMAQRWTEHVTMNRAFDYEQIMWLQTCHVTMNSACDYKQSMWLWSDHETMNRTCDYEQVMWLWTEHVTMNRACNYEQRLRHNWWCKLFRNASIYQNKRIMTKENILYLTDSQILYLIFSQIPFVQHNIAVINAFTIFNFWYMSVFDKKWTWAHHDMFYRHIYI